MPPSVASIPAVHAWPGWAGWQASDAAWQAPDEEPGNDVGPIVHADVPVASLSADETMAEPPVQPRRSVRGQVAAATGEPLAGALVTLVTTDGDEAGHAIAGSDGWFAVGDMREGIYTLIAAAPHFRPAASTFALSSEEARRHDHPPRHRLHDRQGNHRQGRLADERGPRARVPGRGRRGSIPDR